MAHRLSKNIIEAIADTLEGKQGNELQAALTQVVQFLASKKLLKHREAILAKLENTLNKREGKIVTKIRSAAPVDTAAKKEIEQEVLERYQATSVESSYHEDKKLLGGFRIEVGDEVKDTTYRSKLNQLAAVLIK